MKKIFMLLLGIGVFYSAYAACGDVSGSGTYNNGVGTNTNPPPNSPPPSNPNASPALTPTPSSVPGDNDGLGNGGNTQGVGTDKGGGNGPAH
ncbi:hypothetical protein J2N86_02370 [Legionella lytica]|uniref:Uncharacterized protein n=1 Tax=Legionella lytica TaxID=96232 RepID=A0ABY4YA09_9GAMM|nr:hypothetical protein [Legionella lytica]USQ14198.1 hypothetical protein J2N86_02370 [Legionella lytica]